MTSEDSQFTPEELRLIADALSTHADKLGKLWSPGNGSERLKETIALKSKVIAFVKASSRRKL